MMLGSLLINRKPGYLYSISEIAACSFAKDSYNSGMSLLITALLKAGLISALLISSSLWSISSISGEMLVPLMFLAVLITSRVR